MMKVDIIEAVTNEITRIDKDFKSGNWFVLYYQAEIIEDCMPAMHAKFKFSCFHITMTTVLPLYIFYRLISKKHS